MLYLTPNLRKRIYETAVAGCAVAVGYGLLTGEEALLWLGVLVPVLGLARGNVNAD